MGFYHVNLENYNTTAAMIPRPVWELVITLSFFLIWLDYPPRFSKATRYLLVAAGFILLVAMAVVYKGGNGSQVQGMRPSWWGILGIIGWAYLICALLYVLVKGNVWAVVACWAAFVIVNILFHTVIKTDWRPLAIKDGSSAALVMGGVAVSLIYARLVQHDKPRRVWLVLAIIGIALIAAGFALRPYTQGISKIRSTPAWVFICSGITTLVFLMLIYWVDQRGHKDLFSWIRPAGTSTLTCYLLPYFQVGLFELLHITYPRLFNFGITGLLRSFITSFILILLTGLLEKKHLRLKL